jgi:Zn-dependent protease/CBS domain-containing protein
MGIPIARIFGIEIRVTYGWVVVLAFVSVIAFGQLTSVDPALEELVAWGLGGLVALGFFVSSVSHDLAHAVVARRRGVEVRSIGISFFGGATPNDPASTNARDDAVIAASGPIVSLVLGGLLLGLMAAATSAGSGFTLAAGMFATLGFLNLVLGFVNLIPAYPLDGGRLVRDIAWRWTGSERTGWRVAAQAGRLTGLVVIGIGVTYLLGSLNTTGLDATGAMIAITGWFLVLSGNAVRDRVRLDDMIGGHVVSDAMDADPTTVTPTLTVDTFAAQLLDGETPVYAVPVVEGTEVVGLLGVNQVRRIRRTEWANTRVVDVMARPPKLVFLSPTEPLKQGLERVYKAGLDGLPVMDDGRMVGILTKRGVGRFIGEKTLRLKGATPPAA